MELAPHASLYHPYFVLSVDHFNNIMHKKQMEKVSNTRIYSIQ